MGSARLFMPKTGYMSAPPPRKQIKRYVYINKKTEKQHVEDLQNLKVTKTEIPLDMSSTPMAYALFVIW